MPREKFCAFCGIPLTNRNISKEHIWAKWIGKHIPKEFTHTRHTATIHISPINQGNHPATEPIIHAKHSRRPGDSHSQTLRIVCRACNNGWMSRIQDRAKPWLIPFTRREWPDLPPEAIEPIAAWACLLTMVVEFMNPGTMSNRPSDRRLFMERMSPPPNWTILVGRYAGEFWRGAFNHFGLESDRIVDLSKPIPPASALSVSFKRQSTTFCLGSLAFFAHSSHDAIPTNEDEIAEAIDFRILWPSRNVAVTCPATVWGDADIDGISRLCIPPEDRHRMRPIWDHS